jgi:hypothetical protein
VFEFDDSCLCRRILIADYFQSVDRCVLSWSFLSFCFRTSTSTFFNKYSNKSLVCIGQFAPHKQKIIRS